MGLIITNGFIPKVKTQKLETNRKEIAKKIIFFF